jgi:hypothetical protein
MSRQRIRSSTSPLVLVGRALVVLFALFLIWGGVALALLALKVDAGAVNDITGYRSVYDFFAGLGPDDFGGTTRLIVALIGVAALLLFGYLAWKEIPRPYLARRDLNLSCDDRGDIVVEPRAIERLAEASALRQWGVTAASGRYGGDDLSVNVSVRRTNQPAQILHGVHSAVYDALGDHGLPTVPVNVTLTGYKQKAGRELK